MQIESEWKDYKIISEKEVVNIEQAPLELKKDVENQTIFKEKNL